MAASASVTGIRATAFLLGAFITESAGRRKMRWLHVVQPGGEGGARRRGLFSLLQKQPHQFGLARDAGLVEDFGQMATRRPDGNAESVGGGFSAVALGDLKRERCLGRRQAEA